MATEPARAFRDKPPDCWCRYPWRLYATTTEHATDCPAHERICRERCAPATPFPVGSKVLIRIGHDPEVGVVGLVLGVAGDERWVQVKSTGQDRPYCLTYLASQLLPEPEPDPADDVAVIVTGGAGRGEARSR
jgi:hypothetical protein